MIYIYTHINLRENRRKLKQKVFEKLNIIEPENILAKSDIEFEDNDDSNFDIN